MERLSAIRRRQQHSGSGGFHHFQQSSASGQPRVPSFLRQPLWMGMGQIYQRGGHRRGNPFSKMVKSICYLCFAAHRDSHIYHGILRQIFQMILFL